MVWVKNNRVYVRSLLSEEDYEVIKCGPELMQDGESYCKYGNAHCQVIRFVPSGLGTAECSLIVKVGKWVYKYVRAKQWKENRDMFDLRSMLSRSNELFVPMYVVSEGVLMQRFVGGRVPRLGQVVNLRNEIRKMGYQYVNEVNRSNCVVTPHGVKVLDFGVQRFTTGNVVKEYPWPKSVSVGD